MNTSPIYTELKEAITKAVPEIMELKLGCMFSGFQQGVMGDDGVYKEGMIISTEGDEGELSRLLVMFDDYTDELGNTCSMTYEEFETIPDLQILGRDITTDDILQTANALGVWMSISEKGLLHGLVATKENYFWTLGIPLHLQPEPTQRFLHSILVTSSNL